MKPVVVIVGRPNVGKSTLFNQLTKSRDALVANVPGVTRDRLIGEGKLGHKDYLTVDTGGMDADNDAIVALVSRQALVAAADGDVIVFLVDGREGLNSADIEISKQLRRLGKPVVLAVNKTEGMDGDLACAEFHSLGIGSLHAIAAAHGRGLNALANAFLDLLPDSQPSTQDEPGSRVWLSVIGRPNVGKSTLVNRILGEERVVVFDQPGTTRDSIIIPFERGRQSYVLIDTAGVRRRARVSDRIEKFSVVKTLQAIDRSNVVILVLDASDAVTDQDASLLGMALDAGRAIVIAVNKWDGLDRDQRQRIRREIERKFRFVDFARVHYISALHGTGVGKLFPSIVKAFESAFVKVSTGELTHIISEAVSAHPPPLIRGRRIKLRYAHLGGHNPPRIVIHGNQTDAVPPSYTRYLENTVRRALALEGTPIDISFKKTANPFHGRRNPLTNRQKAKRQRLLRHARRKP